MGPFDSLAQYYGGMGGMPTQNAVRPPVRSNMNPMQNYWQGNQFVVPGFLGPQPPPQMQQMPAPDILSMMSQQVDPRVQSGVPQQQQIPDDILQYLNFLPF